MKYVIIDGVFRDSDGSLKGAGQSIELDPDMAKVHGERVKLADDEAPAVQAPALDAPHEG